MQSSGTALRQGSERFLGSDDLTTRNIKKIEKVLDFLIFSAIISNVAKDSRWRKP